MKKNATVGQKAKLNDQPLLIIPSEPLARKLCKTETSSLVPQIVRDNKLSRRHVPSADLNPP